MKNLILICALTHTMQIAQACVGEAQIIARVTGTQLMGSNGCFVAVTPDSVRFFAPNMTCPLELSEVLQSGIEVGVRTEEYCSYNVGDEISGVVTKSQDGQLTLEK